MTRIQIAQLVDPPFPQLCNDPHAGPEQSNSVGMANHDPYVGRAGDENDHAGLVRFQFRDQSACLCNTALLSGWPLIYLGIFAKRARANCFSQRVL